MACKSQGQLQLEHISRLIDEAEAQANEWLNPSCPFSPTRLNPPELEEYGAQGPALAGSPGDLLQFDDAETQAVNRGPTDGAEKCRKRWTQQGQPSTTSIPKWMQGQPEGQTQEPTFQEYCTPPPVERRPADFPYLETPGECSAPWPQKPSPLRFETPERGGGSRAACVQQGSQQPRRRWAKEPREIPRPTLEPKWSQVPLRAPTAYPVCEEFNWTCPDQPLSTPWDYPQETMAARPGREAPKTTTQRPSTQRPTTQRPTTQRPTTQRPTTQRPTTQVPTTQRPRSQVNRVQQKCIPQESSRPNPCPATVRIPVHERPSAGRCLYPPPALPTPKSVGKELSRRPRSRTPRVTPPCPPPNSSVWPQEASRPNPCPATLRIPVHERPLPRRSLYPPPALPTPRSVVRALANRPRSRTITPRVAPPCPPPNSPTHLGPASTSRAWAQDCFQNVGRSSNVNAAKSRPSTSPDSGIGSRASPAGSPPSDQPPPNLGTEVACIIKEAQVRLDCAFRDAFGQSLDDIIRGGH